LQYAAIGIYAFYTIHMFDGARQYTALPFSANSI